MAATAHTASPAGATPVTSLFGVETEYGLATLGPTGERVDPAGTIKALMREFSKLVPCLPCHDPLDLFTVNGSRVYIDAGQHPEVATPECTTPAEVVLYTRAGDRLLARAAQAVSRKRRGTGVEIVIWKGNVDHRTGATWGSHESYLHQASQELLSQQLMTHLVTRTVYTGAGGFSNRSRRLRFVVSPRAMHLEHTISGNSTRGRGIFHTRDEPLANAPYRRLHVLSGESVWSQTADFLRIGTTALLVAQVDAGRQPQRGLDLAAPIEALAGIASDVTCTARVRLKSGERLTAIDIQRRLLEHVQADLDRDHLPSWAPALCEQWQRTLDGLARSPTLLVGVLDWPTKLSVLARQSESQGVEWTFTPARAEHMPVAASAAEGTAAEGADPRIAARLLETDMRFNRIDGRGIFASLDERAALAHALVDDEAIERAVRAPPAIGRARVRAACIERLAPRADTVSCYWDHIVDRKSGARLSLGDPFRSEEGEWLSMLQPAQVAERRSPVLRAIETHMRTRAPRVALAHMLDCLTGVGPVSRETCRHFISILGCFIPTVPLPALRRGVATAAPVLEALFEHGGTQGDHDLEDRAGTLLYRFHEGRGDHHKARAVIERMLARANERGDATEVALLTNNLAYEQLLSGELAQAQDGFERAIVLFEATGRTGEIPSVRANLIESRFAQLSPERWSVLAAELRDTNRVLVERGDWRARKTHMLLARLARQRGRHPAAAAWARRALEASENIPTQLRARDRAFLDALNAERGAP